MEHVLIDTSERLMECIGRWNSLERIAVDFECEFNLHIYGEHLCLVQVYDGTTYYVIDPRANGVSRDGLVAFFTSPMKKVWFDCQSDNSLVYRKYQVSVENILDVRVYALALGFTGNLVSLEKEFLGIEPDIAPGDKKKLQQTNWLRRPLSSQQLDYALSDVASLFALEDVLYAKVVEAGLEEECARQMKLRSRPAEPKPGWVTLGNWKRMTKEQRRNVKQYYIARDVVARRFNVPSYYVLDKHRLLGFALSCPARKEDVMALVAEANPRFQSQLMDSMLKAYEIVRQSSDQS